MNYIKPISLNEFVTTAKNDNPLKISNFETFFSKQINDANAFATGSFFWFIGNNNEMKIVAASQNIGQLTPFSHEIWTNSNALFLAENLHQEDRLFVLSALNLAVKKIEGLPKKRQSDIRVNIYARMLNRTKNYRWVLIQMPKLHSDSKTKSNCAMIMVTDLSHLVFQKKPILMTLTDRINNQNIYYTIPENKTELVAVDLPNITKREQEIIKLMAKGLNSPEIATALFLSVHTVENHKRNLRKKTKTKTSAELIHYFWTNNLI